MNNFKELKVWKEAVELSKQVYETTSNYPKEEIYGLSNQLRRAAISIPSNIAEGSGRHSKKEFSHFLNFSLGSSFELETQLIISKELNFIAIKEFVELQQKLSVIQKMLYGLKKSLNTK